MYSKRMPRISSTDTSRSARSTCSRAARISMPCCSENSNVGRKSSSERTRAFGVKVRACRDSPTRRFACSGRSRWRARCRPPSSSGSPRSSTPPASRTSRSPAAAASTPPCGEAWRARGSGFAPSGRARRRRSPWRCADAFSSARGRSSVDLAQRFVACAAESGIDVFRLHDPLNDVSNLREAASAITAAGREFDAGLVHSPSRYEDTDLLAEQAKRLPELGAARVLIHDPSGSLSPQRAANLVGEVREASRPPGRPLLPGRRRRGAGRDARGGARRRGSHRLRRLSACAHAAPRLRRVGGDGARRPRPRHGRRCFPRLGSLGSRRRVHRRRAGDADSAARRDARRAAPPAAGPRGGARRPSARERGGRPHRRGARRAGADPRRGRARRRSPRRSARSSAPRRSCTSSPPSATRRSSTS